MKHSSNTRRSRNGGNRSGRRTNSRTQVFDSNGPDVRIRGSAQQVYEKYVALARDAASGGDHVLAESYLQHAEHYQRVQNDNLADAGQQQQQPGLRNRANGAHPNNGNGNTAPQESLADTLQQKDMEKQQRAPQRAAAKDTQKTVEPA